MAIKLGLVGAGTVGGGCVEIYTKHKDDILRHYGVDLELVQVCAKELGGLEGTPYEAIFTTDFHDVLNNPEVDIVIELIGGTTFAKEVVLGALRAGKNVVTANKALMATCGQEVMETAEEMGVDIAFEASVGGGIPIIEPLKHSLLANEITKVMGIVNGTTNYMLTRMGEDGLSYDEALREAQQKGFAEADPTADVDGFDAAAKIAILGSIAFHSRITMDQVFCEGIRRISAQDIKSAREMGYAVKLVAHAALTKRGVDVRVHPTMIPMDHQLAHVNGVYNAIYVVGDAVGETMFFGEGAGAGPAASAVMGDVIEMARRMTLGVKPVVGCTCTDELPIVPMDELKAKYYVRFVVNDMSGVLAATAKVFADHDVSVQSVEQRGTKAREAVDLIFLTHTATEGALKGVVEDILALDGVVLGGYPSIIRVED